MKKMLRTIDVYLSKFLKVLAMTCMMGLFIILIANVFFRLVPILSVFPNFSMGWFDEVVEMLFAWLIMTTSSILCRDKAHFEVDLLQEKYKGKMWINYLDLFCNLVTLVFFVALAYYSIQLTKGAVQLSQELRIPKKWFYLCMPFNSIIMSCYTVRDIVLNVKKTVRQAEMTMQKA